jgi:hypothetical protein
METPEMTLGGFNLLSDAIDMYQTAIEQQWDDGEHAEQALAELQQVWNIIRDKWGHLAGYGQGVAQ